MQRDCQTGGIRLSRVWDTHAHPHRHGVPIATNTLVQLFSLSAFWVRLSAPPNFIEAAKPEQNGRHERIYRCLKAETTRRPTI